MKKHAAKFIEFVDSSPSPFHAVQTIINLLEGKGFKRLEEENETWKLEKNGKYYVTRNHSSLLAFAVGGNYEEGGGVVNIAAHTDSPCLKVKPISKIERSKFLQVGVETYGGGLWSTWFDRDLSLAGRVIVREGEGKFSSKLVHIKDKILRIPTLAIHLNRGVNEDGFKFNNENELVPVLATSVKGTLEGKKEDRHHPILLEKIAKEIKISKDDICDFELCLYDTQGATTGGICDEFIFSARLDNLMMSYCAVTSLLESLDTQFTDKTVRMISVFDNEEIGSNSLMGASSTLVEVVFRRLSGGKLDGAIRKSLLVSADMAHGLHPNYSAKHESNHGPLINGGLVIKHNANQRYATNSITAFLIRETAKKHGLPIQDFVVRQDSACGSTIGPIIATSLGVRTVDVGIPQFSMHSIREQCGVEDIGTTVELFTALFNDYHNLNASLSGCI